MNFIQEPSDNLAEELLCLGDIEGQGINNRVVADGNWHSTDSKYTGNGIVRETYTHTVYYADGSSADFEVDVEKQGDKIVHQTEGRYPVKRYPAPVSEPQPDYSDE